VLQEGVDAGLDRTNSGHCQTSLHQLLLRCMAISALCHVRSAAHCPSQIPSRPFAAVSLASMSIFSSSAPTTMSVHLTAVLERLGLTTYSTVLAQNGFRSWETVLDVTEDDLTTLDFKLGHRRVLQREIATYRGLSSTASLDADGNASDGKSSSSPSLQCLDRQTATPPPREKRRYRRKQCCGMNCI
jgi:hypothetical protein